MILKLRLNTDQLAALHKTLSDESNFQKYMYTSTVPDDICPGEKKHQGREAFVFVKSCRAQGGGESNPVPSYDVALEVKETYMGLRHDGQQDPNKTEKTPLDRLEDVFNAIGLFPRTLRQKIAFDHVEVVETEAHDVMTRVYEPHRVPDYKNQEYMVTVRVGADNSPLRILMRISDKERLGRADEKWHGYLVGNKEKGYYRDTINFTTIWWDRTIRQGEMEVDVQGFELLKRLMH